MRIVRLGVPLALLALVSAGCAHATRSSVETERSPDGAPRLLGCVGYMAPTFHWTAAQRVLVQVDVRPDGTVDPSSIRHVPDHHHTGDEAAVTRAVALASGCVFGWSPEGEPEVPVRTRVRFAFDAG